MLYIKKEPAGNDFEGLAKIMDIIAVNESKDVGLQGNVSNFALPEADFLHWKRGFVSTDYFGRDPYDKQLYDNRMKSSLNQYIELRKQGLDFDAAKEIIMDGRKKLYHEKLDLIKQAGICFDSIIRSLYKELGCAGHAMRLDSSKVKEYLKDSNLLINFFKR